MHARGRRAGREGGPGNGPGRARRGTPPILDLRSGDGPLPERGLHPVGGILGDQLRGGDGRDLHPHGAAHPRHPPAGHRRLLPVHRAAPERLLRPHAGAGNGHAGRLRLPGPLPLLRLLGDHAHPDVLHHRDLGRRAAHLLGHQVLPLHGRGLAAHAGGHRGPGLSALGADRRGELRLRRSPGDHHRRHHPAVALRRLRGGLRHQGASRCIRGCPTPTWRRPRRAR